MSRIYKLIEANEGDRKELTKGNLQEIVGYLRENEDLYNWQLENNPEAYMPDFSQIETETDLRAELERIDLGWYTLELC